MGKQLHQDFWKVGSRFYFKKEGGNKHLDMGVISTVTPSFEQESNKTYDPDCGVNTVVETSVTSTTETYALTCLNFNLTNVQGLFKGGALEEYNQVPEEVAVVHSADNNGLLKVLSGTGEGIYGLSRVTGLFSGVATSRQIVGIDVSSGEVTFEAGDAPETGNLIITGVNLGDEENAGSYVIATVNGDVAILDETSRAKLGSADETFLAGNGVGLFAKTLDTGSPIFYEEGADWSVFDGAKGLSRGLIKIPAASSIADGTEVTVIYAKKAITGLREFKAGIIPSWTGEGFLTFSRGGCVDEMAREFKKVILTFTNPSFSVEESSTLELSIEVISVSGDAGRVIDYSGDLTEY